MKAIFMVLIVALASSCATAKMVNARQTRGLIDNIMSALGFDAILSTLTSIGGNVYSQLMSLATTALLHGTNMWNQALPVFNNLLAELQSHAGNAVQLVSQAIQQLTAVVASGPARSSRAGLLDNIVQLTGLNQIMSMISSVGTTLSQQFMSIATQVMFAGQQIWAQATPIFSNLVAELTAHTGNAVQLVSQAIQQLTAVVASGPARSTHRGLLDTLVNASGLSTVWTIVQSAGSVLSSQLLSLVGQLVFAGQQVLEQAKPIFSNLVAELTAHTGNAVQLVGQAVQQLTAVIAMGPARSVNRDFVDFFLNGFGLSGVWTLIQSAGSNLVSQLSSLLMQLVFAGQQVIEQAKPIFSNLVAELTAHTGNAVQLVSQAVQQLSSVIAMGPQRMATRGLVDNIMSALGFDAILSTLTSIGGNVYSQLMSLATTALLHGTNMWNQALPVFNNLLAELQSHAGNAVQLVSQAIQQLTAVVSMGPSRSSRAGLLDNILEFAGLNQIMSMISSVGSTLSQQFMSIATQVMFAGQQIWAQATPIFSNLVAELTAHTGNAVQLVSQAIQQLTAVVASGPARFADRDLLSTILNASGLSSVWTLVQSAGSVLVSQLMSVAMQLVFAGQQVLEQAKPIFNNLVAELTAHTGNAVQLVGQAVQQLTAVIAMGPARSVNRGLLDTILQTTGLTSVWTLIQSAGSSLVGQLTLLMGQLVFAGQQVIEQAKPIFNNLVAELTAHTGNAVQLVGQAVQQLTAVIAMGPQ